MAAVGPSTAHVLESELPQACKSTVLILINGKRSTDPKANASRLLGVQQGTAALLLVQ